MEKAIAYERAPESRTDAGPHEVKFASFNELFERAKSKGVKNVIIAWPWIIGDSYAEVVENVTRLAEAGLTLHVVQRCDNADAAGTGAALN